MRLTNNLMSKNYISNLNDSLSALNDQNERVSASRSYLKASEDPATALKAFQVRRNLARLSIYRDNVSSANDILSEEETALSTLKDIVGNAVTQVLQGRSGTYSADSRKVVADALRGYQEQILSTANSKFGGKYLFGGADVENAPFTLDASGNLLYKGQNVNTGTFTSGDKYIDMGMGINVDASGTVLPTSAFNTAVSGASLLGTGTDANGLSNNVYNLLGAIADKFENNDLTGIDAYASKLDDCNKNVTIQYTGVGERCNFLSYLTTRFKNEESDAVQRQQKLEGIDTAKAIIDFNEQKSSYNACLQMGLKILQPSLLDYLS